MPVSILVFRLFDDRTHAYLDATAEPKLRKYRLAEMAKLKWPDGRWKYTDDFMRMLREGKIFDIQVLEENSSKARLTYWRRVVENSHYCFTKKPIRAPKPRGRPLGSTISKPKRTYKRKTA